MLKYCQMENNRQSITQFTQNHQINEPFLFLISSGIEFGAFCVCMSNALVCDFLAIENKNVYVLIKCVLTVEL